MTISNFSAQSAYGDQPAPRSGHTTLHTSPVSMRVVLDVTFNPNGVPAFVLKNHLEKTIHRAIVNGCLTGETEAELASHTFSALEQPKRPSEKAMADLLLSRIEDGTLRLEQLPQKLVEYGTMEVHQFVAEMAAQLEPPEESWLSPADATTER